MFIRTVKTKRPDGQVHEYIRLVEGYRSGGKVKQRVVAHLGRKDLLAPHAQTLLRVLSDGKTPSQKSTAIEACVSTPNAWDWGPFLVARTLWKELGIEGTLKAEDSFSHQQHSALPDRALVLTANRLAEPCSEHGLARWLETDFACDAVGRQWIPRWLSDEERANSSRPRVRVHHQQLDGWYRTLDQLLLCKSKIETNLFGRLRDLFSLKVDLVFYDLTSTYFEGKGPAEISRHGKSRDEKPRNPQVMVGLVMLNGWPIAHHVFPGNTKDEKTVSEVTQDLEKRFGLKRVVFVGDRGMVTTENLDTFRKRAQGYLVGLRRRRNQEVYQWIEQASGPWLECPVGIVARERTVIPKTLVQEVPSGKEGIRIFVVHSEERRQYEIAMRMKSMERTRLALEKLSARVKKGRLKAPEKIGAAVGHIMAHNHGHRYYDWELKDGAFRYFEHPVHFKREQAYEGKYIIQTEEKNLTPVEAVVAYKELSDVERAFRELKDVIAMRPIFHRIKRRVEAHIFVAALGFLLDRALEKKLKAAGLDLSAAAALQALRSIRVVEVDLGNGQRKRCVTRGCFDAKRVLKALNIRDTSPPSPPQGQWTVML
jgi:transposase